MVEAELVVQEVEMTRVLEMAVLHLEKVVIMEMAEELPEMVT
jgi:hypothetical protein